MNLDIFNRCLPSLPPWVADLCRENDGPEADAFLLEHMGRFGRPGSYPPNVAAALEALRRAVILKRDPARAWRSAQLRLRAAMTEHKAASEDVAVTVTTMGALEAALEAARRRWQVARARERAALDDVLSCEDYREVLRKAGADKAPIIADLTPTKETP